MEGREQVSKVSCVDIQDIHNTGDSDRGSTK